MAWNEPGGSNGSNGKKDPWGKGGNQGPPDLDEAFRKFQQKFGSIFGGGNKGVGQNSGKIVLVILFAVFLVWMAFGLYKVEEAEQGIEFRFGEHVETTDRGLQWRWPYPIGAVEKVDISKVTPMPLRATMLTQDENIVDIEGSVQYQISNATDYLFSARNPEISLTQATESALRQSIGRSKMDYVITDGRSQIADQVKTIIQDIVDQYGLGLYILKVNIQKAVAPEAVKDAFDDVTQAREDEERFKKEAEAYRNEVIPKARGAAARLREEADAYKKEVIAKAEGEAERFTKLLFEYKKAPEITRDRLYLDMMESVLQNSSKVIIDVESGNNLLFLPLDKLMSRDSVRDNLNDLELLRNTMPPEEQRTKTNVRNRGAR